MDDYFVRTYEATESLVGQEYAALTATFLSLIAVLLLFVFMVVIVKSLLR